MKNTFLPPRTDFVWVRKVFGILEHYQYDAAAHEESELDLKFNHCFQCIVFDCDPRPNRAWITFADPDLRLLNPVCLMLSSAALRKSGMRLSEAAGLAKEKAPSEGAYH